MNTKNTILQGLNQIFLMCKTRPTDVNSTSILVIYIPITSIEFLTIIGFLKHSTSIEVEQTGFPQGSILNIDVQLNFRLQVIFSSQGILNLNNSLTNRGICLEKGLRFLKSVYCCAVITPSKVMSDVTKAGCGKSTA